MAEVKALCVYCGSADGVDPRHRQAATDLGREAARRGIEIVFGGGRVGLMGAVASGALDAGGRVTGIIPEHLQSRERPHPEVTRLLVVDSMHTRKRRMFELSDAFCILPGGMGTLDETFEIVTWKQLALHDKPIVLVNLGGYWDPLLTMIEHQAAAGYVRPQHMKILRVVTRVDSVFDALAAAPPPSQRTDEERL